MHAALALRSVFILRGSFSFIGSSHHIKGTKVHVADDGYQCTLDSSQYTLDSYRGEGTDGTAAIPLDLPHYITMEQDELLFPNEDDNQEDMEDPQGKDFLDGYNIWWHFWWGTNQMFR